MKLFLNFFWVVTFLMAGLLSGCGSTQIVESPKTAYVPENADPKEPSVIWSSRTFGTAYDYLGRVSVRSITYNGAMERLVDAGKKLRADALIDVHYEQVGFLTSLEAFAIKYK